MSFALSDAASLQHDHDFENATVGAPDDEVCAHVWGLLTSLYPRGRLVERRRELRYPFPNLVTLRPVDDEGAPVTVVGRHLSERGLGFYHQTPLPYRHVIATLEAGEGRQVSMLVDVSWCRFTRSGWYESGGRFLRVVKAENAP